MKKLLTLIIFFLSLTSNLFSKYCTYDKDEKALCDKECKCECKASFNDYTYTCNKC